MPFGELDVKIVRHRSRTPRIVITKASTISPKTNEQAFLDLQTLLNNLIMSKYAGKLRFDVDFDDGTINLITIKNKEVKTYGT